MTRRTTVQAAEDMLGREIKALDHGFVIPLDYMGSDEDIVQAARVSFGPTHRPRQEDRALLRYLLRHRHTSPFEMCEVKFKCRMPIFVARQWIRHRTANVNEMSMRYSPPLDLYYVPEADNVQAQSATNKQGRDGELPATAVTAYLVDMEAVGDAGHATCKEHADRGVARELARAVLPLSTYTEWIWKIDAHNLLHFLALRLDAHAQYEIRVFAEAMASFVQAWLPMSWEAFEDYRLHAATLSRLERRVLAHVFRDAAQRIDSDTDEAHRSAVAGMLREYGAAEGLQGRELDELVGKLLA